MSERKTPGGKSLSGKDWAGLALFGAGSLGAVLMFLALRADKPLPEYGPLGSIAEVWTSTFGIFPTLFLNGAFMFLAFRMFVLEARAGLVRNLLACLGVTVAMSVLLGAFSRAAGGVIGERTGWFVADKAHLTVGVLLGLVAVFAAVWFGWIRGTNVTPSDVAVTPDEPSAVALASKSSAKTMMRPAVHKTTAANEGVSLAESAALFPDEDDVPVVRKLEPAEAAKPIIPPSPYPEDVRRKGMIPPGAKPLSGSNAALDLPEAPAAPVAPTVYHFTGTRPARVEPDAPSAPTPSPAARAAAESLTTRGDMAREERARGDTARGNTARESSREDTDVDAREIDADVLDVAEEVETRSGARAIAPRELPTPSWEEPAAFRPEEGDEEPVDAYGTPLSLVEKLRLARREAGLEGAARDAETPARAASAAETAEEEVEAELEVVSAASVVEDVRLTEFDEETDEDVDDDEADEDTEEDGEEVDDLFDDADDDDLDEEELDEEESDEDADEDADRRAVAVADDEEDEQEEVDADEEADETDADEVVPAPVRAATVPRELDAVSAESLSADAELEALEAALLEEEQALERDAAFDEDEADEMAGDAADEPAEADVVAPRALAAEIAEETLAEEVLVPEMAPTKGKSGARGKEAAKVVEPAQPSLFDAMEAPAAARDSMEAPVAARGFVETPVAARDLVEAPVAASRDVVLQPQPTVPADRTTKAPRVEADPRLAQLSEIGCLFIERGRVAVSMLQRQYEMDFDAACKVLDDLQEMGLIGPYLGGQRRDILLTRDQWLERVSKAGAVH